MSLVLMQCKKAETAGAHMSKLRAHAAQIHASQIKALQDEVEALTIENQVSSYPAGNTQSLSSPLPR